MSGTILSGDFTVYHKSENRQMRIEWSGGTTEADTRTMKEWYLALQDYFDEPTRMVEGEPMSAQTPTDYTIGLIDNYETDPWFVDRTTMEHLETGALSTSGWTRSVGVNAGIIRVPVNNTNIVAGDIGQTITGDSDSDEGTLLDVTGTGASQFLWIRPLTDTAADSFDNASQGLTCNTHTATQSGAPETGESLWAGVFTQGNIEPLTHIFVYQDGARLTEYKDASPVEDWWEDGHIDKLFAVKEVDSLIDEGYVTVLARQFTTAYAYWIVDLSAGGRNAVPVTSGGDINNTAGYRIITTGAWAVSTYQVGEEIVGTTSGARGVVTSAVTDTSITYYLIGESITVDFQSGETITGQTSGTTSTSSGAPANTGVALLSGLTITHAANNSYDIDEDGTNEYYSIVIDCSDETVADAYKWSQFITRRGATATTNTDGIPAESYLGTDYIIVYTTLNGSIAEGSVITQDTSGATGTVVAHHTTPKILVMRNSRGTFDNTNPIRIDGGNYVTGPTCNVVTPIASAPFGTFAGGSWYCAPGVVLTNVPTADTNKWNTYDDEREPRARPQKVSITISNTRVGDWIALWRLASAGGDIDYDEYTVDSAQGAAPTGTLKVDGNITSDTPTTGRVVIRDVSTGLEYVHRYTSWATDEFTLFGAAATGMEAGSDTDTIVDTGAFTNAQVGDIVHNTSRSNAVAYITEVVSANEVSIAPPITGQTTGDNYVLGYTVTGITLTTSDLVYVPFLLVYEDTGTDGSPGSEDTEITYSAPIPVLLRARNAAGLGYNIKPFATALTIGSTGLSQAVIRNPETIS